MMCGWELFGGVQALGGEITSTLWSLRRGRATALILTFSRNMSKRISVARRGVCRFSSCIYFFWLQASEEKSAEEFLVFHFLAPVYMVCITQGITLEQKELVIGVQNKRRGRIQPVNRSLNVADNTIKRLGISKC
jgi:hypothetical protein